jgi:hypothetical protein
MTPSALSPSTRRRRRGLSPTLQWIMAGLAVLLLGGGLVLAVRSASLVLTEPQANATMVGVISTQVGQGLAYVTTFEFTVGDQTYTIKSVPQSTRSVYRTGQVVPVRYDPANPSHATLAGFRELWLGPLGLLILGAAVGFVSVAVLGLPFMQRAPRAALEPDAQDI